MPGPPARASWRPGPRSADRSLAHTVGGSTAGGAPARTDAARTGPDMVRLRGLISRSAAGHWPGPGLRINANSRLLVSCRARVTSTHVVCESVCMRVVCECYNALDAPAVDRWAEVALLRPVSGSGVLHCVGA